MAAVGQALSADAAPGQASEAIVRPAVGAIARYFLRLGTFGFGGPIALVGAMEDEIVERRRWVTAQEFADAIAFSQLAPGPLAAQVAIYLGWFVGGVRGATLVGLAFIGPSFVLVVGLAALYRRFGGLPWLQGAFYGVGAAVIAVIARSAVRLARTTLAGDPLRWFLFGASAIVTAWTESEIAALFVASGIACAVARRLTPSPTAALLAPVMPGASLGSMIGGTSISAAGIATVASPAVLFLFFASAGLFVFGSGLAIVPFLHGGVVREHHWLTERQFLDAVAVALISPGPVVITVAFIGFLIAGLSGAVAAAAGVFAPVYVLTIVLAPRYARWKSNVTVRAFVDGVTAAATGAIAGAAFVLGRRALVDGPTVAIAMVTLMVLLLGRRRVPEPLLIIAAGVAGVLMRR